MKSSNKVPKTKRSAQPKRVKVDPCPPTIPSLFHFKWQFTGEINGEFTWGYVAELEPELYQRYFKLCTSAKVEHQRLAWALDISSKIPSQALNYLVEKNGWQLLAMSDEDCEIEIGKRVDPESRMHQISVMLQCCEVVLQLQRTIGNSLKPLIETNTTSDQRDKAAKLLMTTFKKTLSILQFQGTGHKGATDVTQTMADGSTIKIPLAVAAIEVAKNLATEQLKAPFKHEVQERLEDIYRNDLVTRRDKGNSPRISWSEQFERAGLKSLPVSAADKSQRTTISPKD